MSAETVAIHVPASLHHRLERWAKLSNRSVENVVDQTLTAGIPPLPDNIPDDASTELVALESLNDEALWQVAQDVMRAEKQAQLSQLLEKNKLATLSETETTKLTELQTEADQLMLRKAYAYVLLKWRGHRLPTPL
jgi:hypothetical protein